MSDNRSANRTFVFVDMFLKSPAKKYIMTNIELPLNSYVSLAKRRRALWKKVRVTMAIVPNDGKQPVGRDLYAYDIHFAFKYVAYGGFSGEK